MSKHAEVLAICERNLSPEHCAIIRSALASDQRMEIIRDAFIEGRDHDAVALIRELDVSMGDHRILGFQSNHMVTAGTSVMIDVRPQIPFKTHRMMVGINCAANFVIEDIRLANRSMTPQACSIPADLFSFLENENVAAAEYNEETLEWIIRPGSRLEGLGLRIDIPWCQPGNSIFITTTNISGMASTFRGAFLGRVSPE